jgi:hypothetical protein
MKLIKAIPETITLRISETIFPFYSSSWQLKRFLSFSSGRGFF